MGDWKWVRNGSGEFLFNLADDIGERKNLAGGNLEKTLELRGAFEDWLHEVMVEAEPRRPFKDF